MKNEYKGAFGLMRTHRIDLNLIVDLNPSGFLENITLFNKQVERTDFLNLFITSLKNETFEELEYLLTIEEIKKNKEFLSKESANFGNSKINTICHFLRNSLETINK